MKLPLQENPRTRGRKTARAISGFVVAAGIGIVLGSTLFDWFAVMNRTNEVTTDPALMRQYHSVETPTPEAEPSDHISFTLDELMSPGGKPRDSAEEAEPAIPPSLDGEWASAVQESNVVTDFDWNDCPYAIGDFTLSLKESDGRIFGVGIHSLSTTACPSGDGEITTYDAVSGTVNSEYVKLTVLDGQSGVAKFAYLGTIGAEGIRGQIRSMDGQLLLQHVELTRQ